MEDLKSLIEIMKDMTPEQREKFMDFVLKLIEKNNPDNIPPAYPIWVYPYWIYKDYDRDIFTVSDTTTYSPTIASGDNYFLFTAE